MSGGREDENLHDHLFESMNWIGLERELTHAGCFLLPPGAGFFITAGSKSWFRGVADAVTAEVPSCIRLPPSVAEKHRAGNRSKSLMNHFACEELSSHRRTRLRMCGENHACLARTRPGSARSAGTRDCCR
jgi:hypothetical protein